MPQVSVFLVSKSPIWLLGLRTLSQYDSLRIVGEAGEASSALQLAKEQRPQVLVANADDLTHDFLVTLRAQLPELRIVVIEGDHRSPEPPFASHLLDLYVRRSTPIDGLREALLGTQRTLQPVHNPCA